MKLTLIVSVVTISLCAGLCCPEEEYYPSTYHSLENYNLVSIQNNVTNLTLGETIYIETRINNQQISSDNEPFLISDFQSEAYPLRFHLSLYKLNPYGNFDPVNLNIDSLENIDGYTSIYENYGQSSIFVSTILENEQYINTFGITVLETGTYYIGRENFDLNNGTFFIYTNNENGSVQITTEIVNANQQGLYEFIVE